MQRNRRVHFLVLSLVVFFAAQPSAAQKGNLQIDYTVSVAAPEKQVFHVTTNIKNIKQPRLDLSLPTWTPGWYTVENYAKNFLRFRITDVSGKVLPHTMSRKQTWNVDTKNIGEIKIEFDYRADTLALNQAKIAKDFAFFTGTELFLQPEGHRQNASTIHFSIPQNWKIISALKETSDPLTFTANDYDTLVDAPTEMGNFDVARFVVEGKPHYFVATPAGAFSTDKSKKFTDLLAKAASAESAIFGGLPYEKYVYFYFFLPPESNASGALEHLNSHVSFAPPGNIAQPERMINTAAHEFFHLWNVKRIRPAEMYPYDYSTEDETPLLWVSEGFTNYYANVATYRAGIITQKDFLDAAARAISGVENNPARGYISPAEASVSTWLGYDSPTAFGISYYTQGQNLGALLDLSILRDTNGKRSLDDVMRSLYKDFYLRDRGFTTEDMISEISLLTRKDYHDFYRRYVFGTEIPNYDEIFGYAGYKIEKKIRQVPVFGFGIRNRNGGFFVNDVEADSPAANAKVQVGDVITKINGEDFQRVSFGELAGKKIKLTIKRENQEREISMNVGSRDETNYVVSELLQPTTQQLKIREIWLKR
jgi:predicted metalloprotease with PDZ domain